MVEITTLCERLRLFAIALTYSMQSEEARAELGDLRCGPHMAAEAMNEARTSLEQLTTDLDTVVRALETASKRLNTIALVRFAADKFDPYDLPKVETLRTWAEDAREALSNIKREGL